MCDDSCWTFPRKWWAVVSFCCCADDRQVQTPIGRSSSSTPRRSTRTTSQNNEPLSSNVFSTRIINEKIKNNKQQHKIRIWKNSLKFGFFFVAQKWIAALLFVFLQTVAQLTSKSTVFNNNNNRRWWQQQQRAAIREQHQVSQGRRFTPHFFPDRWFWRLFLGSRRRTWTTRQTNRHILKTKTTAWISHIAKRESKIHKFCPTFLKYKFFFFKKTF